MTAAVTQKGTGRCLGCGWTSAEGSITEGRESVTKEVTSRSLSAMGSRICPSCEPWLNLRAKSPSSPSVTPASTKIASAQPKRW
jgi:hypothetical protein